MHTSEGKIRQYALLDAGVFIGALLKGDPRHQEARLLVERARHGELTACTTAGIQRVYTYDTDDWQLFEVDGLKVVGPESVLARSNSASER